jgi:Spy/CpxP family protein refolding chaperone
MLKIRAAAMSAAAVIGFAAFASAQVPAKQDSTMRRHERRAEAGARRDNGELKGKRHGHRGMRGREGQGRMMKDLNLTDAQKSRVKAIHAKYRPQFEALRKQSEPQFKAMRDARQKGDTSAATRARFRTQMEQFRTRSQAIRQQEQNELRATLTADQRAKWDAAVKARQTRQTEMKKKFDERRGRRG